MKQVTVTGTTVNEALESALKQLQTTKDNVEIRIIDEGKKGFLGMGSRLAIVRVSIKNENVMEKLESFLEEKTTDSQKPLKENSEINTEEKLQKQQEDNSESQLPDTEVQQEMDSSNEPDPIKQKKAIEALESFIQDVATNMDAPVMIESSLEGKYITLKLTGEKIALLIGKRGQTLNALQYLAQLVVNRDTEQYLMVILDAEGYRKRRNETLTKLAHRTADKVMYTKKEIKLEPMPSYERKVIHAALVDKYKVKTFSVGVDPNRCIVITPNKE